MHSTTTKVEVLEQAGKSEGGFDPRGIYERESPGVVTVIATGLAAPGSSNSAGLGSGFVHLRRRRDRHQRPRRHQRRGRRDIRKASNVFVRFADGNQVPAQVKGFDPFADVALLKIDPEGLTLRPLPLGSTKDLHVGAPVAAIGSPFGEEQSLSVGVISALDRSIQSLTGFDTTGAIQTDAAINHGNSGGPLLDGRGRVLGINAQIQTSTGDGSGVGFAVPGRRGPALAGASCAATGARATPTSGWPASPSTPSSPARFDLPVQSGAWIQDVTADGPAAARPPQGRAATPSASRSAPSAPAATSSPPSRGTPVHAESDLAKALLDYEPGDTVTLDVRRGRRAPAGAREAGRAAARRAAARLTQLLSRACSSRSPSDRRPSRTTRTSSGAISSRRSASSPSP